ncbi:carbonic anhydrase [Micromonospora echinofusca]|uniref:carbonic anhydrase n=1 Tax=Micromonospora echinofusca TaxID=47858 RepID=A0ABS3VP06_MICEH|nr:carbonic anhydrase [Micromonospora echinofusca]MBO4206226.1 carbonic anhydrase [Micromonospora echinofusca]
MRHHHISRRSLLAAGGATAFTVGAGVTAPQAAAAPLAAVAPVRPSVTSPDDALGRLVTGNQRFAAGCGRHPRQTLEDVYRLAAGQHPFAVIVGCADSRVAPEVIFDQGLGDLFDNRVAGNIVDDLLLGSVEFAVEEFHSPLIVVLGHERCGAITATIDAIRNGGSAPGHIGTIVDALRPIVAPVLSQPGDPVDNAVRANVRAQAQSLLDRSEIIAERVRQGALQVVGARYDLDNGQVALVS